MKIKAVLFDLDGTLLPMDFDTFFNDYFGRLAAYLAPHGYEPKVLVDAVMKGTHAMVKNDGSMTNIERVWSVFNAIFGEGGPRRDRLFESFYAEEFPKIKDSCGYTPEAAEVVAELKRRGYRVALATSPIFPMVATRQRMDWVGLSPEDFEFISTYENFSRTKPNLGYYEDALKLLGLRAEECVMIGNNVAEDMVAEKLGMHVFLVPRDLINPKGEDVSRYPCGSLAEAVSYVEQLG